MNPEPSGRCTAPETHLIPSAFEAIRGQRPALEIFGDKYPTPDGTCVRDYIHVSDLAEAHVLALEYLAGGTSQAVNLGTGRGHSVREILSTIKRVTGREVPSRMAPPRPGDPPELVADPTPRRKAAELEGQAVARRNCGHRLEMGRTRADCRRSDRQKVRLGGSSKKQSAIDPASRRQKDATIALLVIGPN